VIGWAACRWDRDWTVDQLWARVDSGGGDDYDAADSGNPISADDCRTWWTDPGADITGTAMDFEDNPGHIRAATASAPAVGDFLGNWHGTDNSAAFALAFALAFAFDLSSLIMLLVFGGIAVGIIVAKVAMVVMIALVIVALVVSLWIGPGSTRAAPYAKFYVGLAVFTFGISALFALLNLITGFLVGAGARQFGPGSILAVLWSGFAPATGPGRGRWPCHPPRAPQAAATARRHRPAPQLPARRRCGRPAGSSAPANTSRKPGWPRTPGTGPTTPPATPAARGGRSSTATAPTPPTAATGATSPAARPPGPRPPPSGTAPCWPPSAAVVINSTAPRPVWSGPAPPPETPWTTCAPAPCGPPWPPAGSPSPPPLAQSADHLTTPQPMTDSTVKSRTPNAAELCCFRCYSTSCVATSPTGGGSVETQQIPAILEVADGVRGVVGVGVPHARRSVPEVVTEIECHYPATDSIFGVVRWSGWGTPQPDVSLVDLGMSG